MLKGIPHNKSEEIVDGLKVYHPRYILMPGYLKCLDGYFFYLFLNHFIKRFFKDRQVDVMDIQWPFPDGFAAVKWGKHLIKKWSLP